MFNNYIAAKCKTKILLQYIKDYGIREPLVLGLVFRLWSELEVMDKGIFLDDLTLITEEPLLVFSSDDSGEPTALRFKGVQYNDINEIFEILQECDLYYINLVFSERAAPDWYLGACEPNPYIEAIPALQRMIEDIEEQMNYDEGFMKIYKEALLVLIDNALETGDRKLFMLLSEEWRRIA